MVDTFDRKYSNIQRWIVEHDGWIQLGDDPDGPLTSFVRALDMGRMPWEGRSQYRSLDEALQDLDSALAQILKKLYG
ncbi:hypothetical protein [Baaleninema simplex]|uniref:hypothetical protein n=1 Tax=Baaleninema simplex TaxID=2862350 RepID=UPI00034BC218|nr:hypothetical protein [Baaleninema simplex]